MTQDKAQAAGAVSIDSPEFRELLHEMEKYCVLHENHDKYAVDLGAFIAHIDAHAAQRYEAGEQNERAEFEAKWASPRLASIHRHANGKEYISVVTQAAWTAWQASRACMALSQPGANAVCQHCGPDGLMASDGSGPYDCYLCGKKAATAPVSQPAAQEEGLSIAIETLRKVAGSEWHMKSQLQQMCIDALSAIDTAPQPLSAPAGSEQEVTDAMIAAFENAVPTHTRDSGDHPNDEGHINWRALSDEPALRECLRAALAPQQEQSK